MRVVAEAGQCMEGSSSTAIQMADAAKRAGAWGFKVQLLDPARIAHPCAKAYWQHASPGLSQQQAFADAGIVDGYAWKFVRDYCATIGLAFGATPFDLDAVALLGKLEPDFVKVASGDITYRALIEACATLGRPLVISTGAATLEEVDRCISWLDDTTDLTLLACSLIYPCATTHAHLARIESLRASFPKATVGYSDHTSDPDTALAAACMGAELLEVHFTTNPGGELVADHAMAVDPPRLRDYVRAGEKGRILRGSTGIPVRPADIPDAELRARIGARRALWWARDVEVGEEITADMVDSLRPGPDTQGGLDPCRIDEIVGRVTARRQAKGERVSLVGIR